MQGNQFLVDNKFWPTKELFVDIRSCAVLSRFPLKFDCRGLQAISPGAVQWHNEIGDTEQNNSLVDSI